MLSYHLFLELLLVGFILLVILLVNNILLYRQSIRDLISMMLISDIVMSIMEILWIILIEHPDPRLNFLQYIAGCGYCLAFIIFTVFLNMYLLEKFGIRIDRKKALIGYVMPVGVFLLLCITTPLTHLLIWVDENGVAQDGVLLYTLFIYMLLFYFLSPAFIGVWFLTLGKNKRPADCEISASVFVFSIMVPVLYYLEILLIDDPVTVFQTISLPVSVALVYLITNESTRSALKAQARMEAVETDLRIASKIQADALPPVAPEFAVCLDLNLRGSMSTAKEVGGDFFDYFPVGDNRLCFLIADVSGKGTPAALFMMTAKTMIKDYALNLDSTSEIFTAVNARLCESNEAGMFATAWIGILDTKTRILQYTNAGHNYPIIKRKGRPCEKITEVHGLFLGGLEFTQYLQDDIQLEPGDRLLLYTDGVVEAHNQAGGLYGDDRLRSMVDSNGDLPGEQVLESIFTDVNEFATGVPQFDDITMVILSIKE